MRKLEYDEANELQRQGKIVCGYLRVLRIDKGRVYGKCSLWGGYCRNHELPNCQCDRIKEFFERGRR